MDRTKVTTGCPDNHGIQPECAPLAVPFVPFQQTKSRRYEQMEALSEGTLFPGLNLPFHLARNGRPLKRCPRTELMALCFVVHELGLYLDTHPDDKEAFAQFQKYAKLLQTAKKTYQEMIGPLMQMDAAMDDSYTWVNAPWPWQNPDKEG